MVPGRNRDERPLFGPRDLGRLDRDRGRGRPDRPGRPGQRRTRLPRPATDDRRGLPRWTRDPRRQPGSRGRAGHGQCDRPRPGGSRGVAPRTGADLLAGQPGQEAAAGREGHHPAGTDRHEPRQRRVDGPLGRAAGGRAAHHRRRDLVLRPDHRAGRAGTGRAERHPTHDRRGQADRGLGRAPVAAVPRVGPGGHGDPPRDERGHPAGRGIDRGTGRGHDPAAQRQCAEARGDPGPT